ncbi:hypothetical protein KAFR_0J01070 [Kazachstania africana CBS 2517]|uniref:FHA domain-containing protein n=1 Tax=Kazachstania africana (strain ATCC 22294 / BCRC 22015 / CBS 2517 / CECT 1963 / NBRC 1671 / NRRL Y-8276) TaxID=1071382 RepID=H2B0M4_KAZAF|nr:hypothetical protein KAFR_0J01070 [Kazachstania africana CBS 2517]CCF60174.1 hypothetical protein KAFR_0J01070 [Kazachstania africana CBS 2517]
MVSKYTANAMKRHDILTSSNFERNKKYRVNDTKIMPIFEPSGLLESESNKREGFASKHVEPADSIVPIHYWNERKITVADRPIIKSILYKQGIKKPLREFYLDDKNHYIIGRLLDTSIKDKNNEEKDSLMQDIPIPDEGCSKEHCVIQFRQKHDKLLPYILDLNSSNGTCLNGTLIPKSRYIELRNADSITFSEFPEDSEYELIFINSQL